MALALYRKYRPQTFKDITNQNHVKITLEREVATGKRAHAYLFSGPRGVGKTSMARIFAKAVNCETRKEGKGEPCNECAACKEITAGRSLDVLEIDAASHRGIDTVRETIIETAKFAPSRLKCKVFIIDEVHMLTTEAWNALLKIMEEPPSHVIFVLATTEVHKVPATILSRCQRFDFHRIAPADMLARLQYIVEQENIKVATPVLKAVARLSEGCVRDGESMLEQLLSLGEKEITEEVASVVLPRSSLPAALDLVEAVFSGNVKQGIELVNRYLDEGFELSQFSSDTVELLRKLLLIKSGAEEIVKDSLEAEAYDRLSAVASQASVEKILHVIEVFLKAMTGLRTARIPQLPLELAVVEGVGGLEAHPKASASQLQGSSFARPGRTADAPNAARPQPPDAPLRSGEKEKEARRAPARADNNPILDENDTTSALREGSRQDSLLSRTPVQNLVKDARPQMEKGKELSLEEIKSKWPEVLKRAQVENHSLPFLLSTSEPLKISGDMLQVGVQYAFHKEKLNETKVRLVLEKILSEQFEVPLRTQAEVYARAAVASSAVDDILSTLGGRVVE